MKYRFGQCTVCHGLVEVMLVEGNGWECIERPKTYLWSYRHKHIDQMSEEDILIFETQPKTPPILKENDSDLLESLE